MAKPSDDPGQDTDAAADAAVENSSSAALSGAGETGERTETPMTGTASAAESAPVERDFDVTLTNNDAPTSELHVIARGTDPGLAAQAAMRDHPGWTAAHEKTRPHDEG